MDIDLKKLTVTADAIARVPAPLARRLRALPLGQNGEGGEEAPLLVAFRDAEGETDAQRAENAQPALDAIESACGLKVVPVWVKPDDRTVFDRLHRLYYPKTSTDAALGGGERLFRTILCRALAAHASDIHVDADADGSATIGLRRDGKLRKDLDVAPELLSELVTVIKLQADLDIAEKRTPLDGAIRIRIEDEEVTLRVATIPTVNGEHLTLRILSGGASDDLTRLDTLGLSEKHLCHLHTALDSPNGLVLVSGPTGSGKTTTLYAGLRALRDRGDRHIISLEDPVEMPLPGITQVKIDTGGERVTFNKALRSVLRHDPDVVLIGEIRDAETADIAVKAALTGHLVLSTVHTNDAIGVVTRLFNLGVPPYLVASTVRLMMAQRLVRRPSPYGLSWRKADAAECVYLGCDSADPPDIPSVKGTPFDGFTGYAGRTALYELVPVDDALRALINASASEADMARRAFDELNLPSLRRDGIQKTLQGLTTLDEVKSICLT